MSATFQPMGRHLGIGGSEYGEDAPKKIDLQRL